MNEQLIELQQFKKNKREVFVNWTQGIVEWKDKTYKIRYIKANGKHYPYVVIEQVKPLSEIRPSINAINKNKSTLKQVEYECNGNSYYVIGIGPIAIQAYKNDEEEWKWFNYSTTEGQYLLQELMNALNNQVVLVEE